MFFLAGFVSQQGYAQDPGPYRVENQSGDKICLYLAVQPCWEPETTDVLFRPLVHYLADETGLNVKLMIADDEIHFHRLLRSADMAIQDSYSTLVHRQADLVFEPVAIAVSEDGSLTERGAVLVRADSPIKDIGDLKGRTFLFGAPHNAPKFFAAYITLMQHGVHPLKDLAAFALGNECSYNAMAVYLGEFDAGMVCADFVSLSHKFNFKTDLRVLAYTPAVPNWLFTLSNTLPFRLKVAVKKALTALNPGTGISKSTLRKICWKGFVPVRGDELEKIRRLQEEYKVPSWAEVEKSPKMMIWSRDL